MKKKVGIGVNKTDSFEENIDNILDQLKDVLGNHMDRNKALKLLYWINDWSADYLKNEQTFNYRDLMRYKRGSVVEADLGFKVGSEQGGLHYCIILDNRNVKDNRILTVIPLESLPDDKTPEDINQEYEVFLGYGIFKDDIIKLEKEITKLENKIIQMKKDGNDSSKKQGILQYLNKELLKLKKGSVAQLSQICALSKMRIYTPKSVGDRFGSYELDPTVMEEIDTKLAKLYLNKKFHSITEESENKITEKTNTNADKP